MENTVNLHSLFFQRQEEMRVTLEGNRKNIRHPGVKGTASELNWTGTLQAFLPERYKVAKAIIVDADGFQSNEIDIVIYDRQYCPLLFKEDGALYVPAESVYAAVEVKQEFASNIEYAGDKVASVRRLRRTSVPIVHAGGKFTERQPIPILGGLVALEGGWDTGLSARLPAELARLTTLRRLDVGCALNDGAFDVTYKEDGTPQIEQSKPESALMFFLMRLMHRLQQVGTVTAIDLREYGKAL